MINDSGQSRATSVLPARHLPRLPYPAIPQESTTRDATPPAHIGTNPYGQNRNLRYRRARTFMILNRKLSPFRQSHSMSNGSEEIKGHAFVARGGEIARRGGPSLTGALPLVILLLFAILPYS